MDGSATKFLEVALQMKLVRELVKTKKLCYCSLFKGVFCVVKKKYG